VIEVSVSARPEATAALRARAQVEGREEREDACRRLR
jgi:hypothetical protein